MAIQSHEGTAFLRVLTSLRGEHVRGFRKEDFEIMAARWRRRDFDEAGSLIGLTGTQARTRWNRVCEVILVRLGEFHQHDDFPLGSWMVLYGECCAAPAWALVENDRRFAS